MTRLEAIEHLKNIAIYSVQDGYTDEARQALDMAIKALEESHWIPCSERLPEEDEDVLVCSEEGDIDVACWMPEQWTEELHIEWWSGEYRVYAVAWMPLPKPYGGEDDKK